MNKAAAMIAASVLSMTSVTALASENICATQEMAKGLISTYNGFDWPDGRQVVDIENLVTVDDEANLHSCHGIWDLADGRHIEGTVTFKLNVAGDPIATYKEETLESALLTSQPRVSETFPTSTGLSSSFTDGARDRLSWEAWFNGLSEEERDGAYYWSARRSSSHPGGCMHLGGRAEIGCLEAKDRLDPSDLRRKTDPYYKAGWNSIQNNVQ